jgi:DNA-binding MarR family transcriptional regulator
MANRHYRAGDYKARSSIGYLIRRAQGLIYDGIEPAFAERGFTFVQWIVMMQLRDGIASNSKDICHELRHDSGALSRVLDQLAQQGLVERERSLTDRRMVDLTLTEAGERTVASLIPIVTEGLNGALADFSHEEFTELTRLLLKFNAGMEKMMEKMKVSREPS